MSKSLVSRRATLAPTPLPERERGYPLSKFLLRHHVLTVLAVGFILQSGLVPFDFRFDVAVRPVRHALEFSTNGSSFPDIVANLFLYVPLGMFLHWSLARIFGATAAWVVTVMLCALLSGAIEWVQAYSPSRVSSLIDVTTNAVGAALGAFMSSVGRSLLPRLTGAALIEFRERPVAGTLKAYCGLLVVVAAIPFSFSFDAAGLGKAVKASVFVPFGHSAMQRSAQEQAGSMPDGRALVLLRWERMKRWPRWAGEAASFMVLVWLLQVVLRVDYGFGRQGAMWLTLWLCGLFAVSLSGLQLPIVSRGCDVTDVLFRWLGIAAGLGTCRSFHRRAAHPVGRGLLNAASAGLVAYIIYTGLLPFGFAVPRDGVWGPLSATAFLPFMAYFETRFDLMMTDALEKFAAYALLAASLSVAWTKVASLPIGPRLMRVSIAGIMLASGVEVAQMFLPVRVVSLTDPIVAAAGCVVGALLSDYAVRFYRYAVRQEALGPHDRPVDPRQARLSLTDELIAALTEPDSKAPLGPAPSVSPASGSQR